MTELPVRTARFVARKQWIVCGSDDMFIRVYNYNTSELVRPHDRPMQLTLSLEHSHA